MATLAFFLLSSTGLALAVMFTAKHFGVTYKPFTCSLCCGFWCGLIMAVCQLPAESMSHLSHGFAAAAFCWIAYGAVTGNW